ncbi:MAG: Jag N-terminal domain-containing protein [Oscillospiraceae bacterium]|nr:Jag N-terminal domain-containing protein [Oscillospiraceae bacterium]
MATSYIDVTGRNEDKAIEAALAQLKLTRDDVSVEVLERAKSGFLGIGATPAKVRVTYQTEDKQPAAAPQADQSAPEAPAVHTQAPEPAPEKLAPEEATPAQPEQPTAAPAECGQGDEKVEKIVAFLTGLLEHMQLSATPVVQLEAEGIYQVNLEGEHLGGVIGRRGETLDAIQQLTNYAVNRGCSKRVRIHLDVEHYRAKREETLVRLAQRVADKVIRYQRNVSLEPMNAYERHVIHAALQDYPGVTTYSTGTDPNRRVVVALEKK